MTNAIEVKGSRNTIFIEGSGYTVKFKNEVEVLSNNTSKRHVFKGNKNKKQIFLSFSNSSSILQNKIYITEEQANDYKKTFSDNYNISPFKDTERNLKFFNAVIKDNIRIKKISGGNEFFLREENKPFSDREEETTRDLVNNAELNSIIDYPFSFNYNNFFNRGFRIDAFSNVNKIKRSQTIIDELKGFSSNSYRYGKNAFGNNNNIQDHLKNNYDTVPHFEDIIDAVYLYNNIEKIVTKITGRTRNPITRTETIDTSSNKEIIYSQESRYFIDKEVKIEPFRDKSYNSNSWWLDIKENKFIASDSEINQKLLDTRELNDTIIEDKKYYSRGKDIDLSTSNGVESIIFHEVLN